MVEIILGVVGVVESTVDSMLNFSVCALVGVVEVELELDVGSMLNFSFVVSVSVAAGKVELVMGVPCVVVKG